MQNTISLKAVVYFVDDNLAVVTGTVVNIEGNQATVKRADGRLFTGHVDLLIPLPEESDMPVPA